MLYCALSAEEMPSITIMNVTVRFCKRKSSKANEVNGSHHIINNTEKYSKWFDVYFHTGSIAIEWLSKRVQSVWHGQRYTVGLTRMQIEQV